MTWTSELKLRSRSAIGSIAALASLLLILAAALGATLPSRAEAQQWLENRERTEGPGFRIGDFELHPGLGIQVGWDSNLYYSSGDLPGGAQSPVDTGILRVTPHLLFSTIGQQRSEEGEGQGGDPPTLTFRGGVSGSLDYFMAVERLATTLDAGFQLHILPQRPFSIEVSDQMTYSDRPFTENFSRQVDFTRVRNDAGVDFNIATSGEVLKFRAGYHFLVDFFGDQNSFAYGRSFGHQIDFSESFRILPHTGLVHDTRIRYNDYYEYSGGMGVSLLNNSWGVRTRVGVNGAITPEFSVLGMIGYAGGFFDNGTADYDSLVVQVEGRLKIDENLRLSFGYDRDFVPSFLGNALRIDRGHINFQMLVLGALMLGAHVDLGGYQYIGFITDSLGNPLGNSNTRSDIRVNLRLYAEYRFIDWLGVNASIGYQGSITDYRYNIPDSMGGTFIDAADYHKVQLMLGVRAFY